jgi:hypothetical protein
MNDALTPRYPDITPKVLTPPIHGAVYDNHENYDNGLLS